MIHVKRFFFGLLICAAFLAIVTALIVVVYARPWLLIALVPVAIGIPAYIIGAVTLS